MTTGLIAPNRAAWLAPIYLRASGVALVLTLGAAAWSLVGAPPPSTGLSTGLSLGGQSHEAASTDLAGSKQVAGIPSEQHLGEQQGPFRADGAQPPQPSPPVLAVNLDGSRSNSQREVSIETATQSGSNRIEPEDGDTILVTNAVSAPASIDLNTATVQQLNALRGGALIGQAIVRGRPYTSPEDLLRKRIVRRSTYERVKNQITVR